MCDIKSIKVEKRTGELVVFDKAKISNAVASAIKEVYAGDVNLDNEVKLADIIADELTSEIEKMPIDYISVEEIQDMVEHKLMAHDKPTVAKAYIIYRNDMTRKREKKSSLIKKVASRINATFVDNSNANVDGNSFSGREKEASSEVLKAMAIDYDGLPRKVAENHKNMIVYQHDLEKTMIGMHNCLNIDFNTLFTKGFSCRNGDVRPPKSFASACQLEAVCMQAQSQDQFGGCGATHIDYDLAPFVKMSYARHLKNGLKYVANWAEESINMVPDSLPIYDNDYAKSTNKDVKAANQYAMDMLEREGHQGAESLYHNLNTLESRPGSQVPFTSINFGRDTSPEGRKVSEWLLNASISGIGKYHRTSIFPISIFQYKQGCNANPDDPNYDLKQLALKSMSKRIYPNFVNCDWSEAHEDPNDIDTFMSTMGCRTMLGYDRHGMGYKRTGRGNNVPNTIILPKIGIECGICLGKREKADLDLFWKLLDDALLQCEEGLLARYEIMKKQSPSAAKFMYKNGSIANCDKLGDTVEECLKHNTLAFGFIGMAEMCQAMFGKNHIDPEVHKFALSVIKHMSDYVKDCCERYDLNFSLYFTPAEGLCHTAAKALRAQYGVIENVTSREYLTNSCHIPVWEKVSIYDKLRLEAPFTKYATGGVITYVELESTFMNNTKAIEDIIDYAFKVLDIPYLAFNFPIDTCLDCGYQSEFNDRCPMCGSTHIEQLRRVTGYLSTDYRHFNKGKIDEVQDRVKHSSYTDFTIKER